MGSESAYRLSSAASDGPVPGERSRVVDLRAGRATVVEIGPTDIVYDETDPGRKGGGVAGTPGGLSSVRGLSSLALVVRQAEQRVARRIEVTLAGEQLSIDQWRVLHVLSDGEGHPMSGIAGTLMVPGPTLTKIVERLVDAALVYRLVDDADRRRVLAFLSERGRELHARLVPDVSRVEQEILGELGAGGPRVVALLHRLGAGAGPSPRAGAGVGSGAGDPVRPRR